MCNPKMLLPGLFQLVVKNTVGYAGGAPPLVPPKVGLPPPRGGGATRRAMAPRGNTSPELFSPSPEGGSRYAGGPGRGAAGRQSGGVQPKTGRDSPQDGRPPPENRGPGARTFGRDYLDNETVNPIRF